MTQVCIIYMEDFENYNSDTVVTSLEQILDDYDSFCVQWGTLQIYL